MQVAKAHGQPKKIGGNWSGNIKDLETKLDLNREEQRRLYGAQKYTPEVERWNKELRRLRRLRT